MSSTPEEITINTLPVYKNYSLLNRDRLNHAVTCDIELVFLVADETRLYPSHREVLGYSYEYFQLHFDNENKSLNPLQVRALKDIPVHKPEILENLLTLAYTGKLSISDENAFDVFHDSVILRYKYMGNVWESLKARVYTTSHELDAFHILHRHFFKSEMWYEVVQYIAKYFKGLSLKLEYLKASFEKMSCLLRYLPKYIDDREYFLDFIISWGQYKYAERKYLIPKLLEYINIGNISGSYAKELLVKLFKVERCYRSELNRNVIVDGETRHLRTFVYMKNRHFFILEYEFQKNGLWRHANAEIYEKLNVSKFAIVGDYIYNLQSVAENKDRLKYFYSFKCAPIKNYRNLIKLKCEKTYKLRNPYMGVPVHNFEIASLDKNIYLYPSGIEGQRASKQMMSYNCDRNEWSQVPCEYLELTTGGCLVGLNNLLYILGGFPVLHPTKGYCARYDTRTGRWRTLKHMQQAHINGSTCTLNGKIYVAGGRNFAGETINTVEMYDPVAGKWNVISSLNMKREYFKLVPFNNRLWAIGHTYSLSIEIYDPSEDIWSLCEYSSLMRAQGNQAIVNLWKPLARYADYCDTVPGYVMEALAF